MPRNNSSSRKEQRREIARSRDERHIARRGELQKQADEAAFAVLLATKQIIDDAACELNVPEHAIQRQHACGKEATCSLPPKACSALNQNMPPDMIVGQQSD